MGSIDIFISILFTCGLNLHVLGFFDPTFVITLRYLNRECYKVSEYLRSKKIFSNLIRRSANKVYSGFDEKFWKLIQSKNAVISGSFLLKLLNNEQWINNDIDIYWPAPSVQTVIGDSSEQPRKFPWDAIFCENEVGVVQFYASVDSCYIKHPFIEQLCIAYNDFFIEMDTNSTKKYCSIPREAQNYQVICLRPNITCEEMILSFDFNFLKILLMEETFELSIHTS